MSSPHDDPALTKLMERLTSEWTIHGPSATLENLARDLERMGTYRQALETLLLQARLELGLPAIIDEGGLGCDVPETTRAAYEQRYVAAVRRVGHAVLAAGDLVNAWPYFRLIGEPEPIREALEEDRWLASGSTTVAQDDDPAASDQREQHAEAQFNRLVEIAFYEGAHPARGWQFILERHGLCAAITAFDQLPPDRKVRGRCAGLLAIRLREQLRGGLIHELERRGATIPDSARQVGAPLAPLWVGRPELFADDAYHIDLSHLAATVRLAPLSDDPQALSAAIDLADYGTKLAAPFQQSGDPPFEALYPDHALYLRGLLGDDPDAVERAIAWLEDRLPTPPPSSFIETLPAQALARLLIRHDRLLDAARLAATYLYGVPETALTVPTPAQLCLRAGPQGVALLVELARTHHDLPLLAAALALSNAPNHND